MDASTDASGPRAVSARVEDKGLRRAVPKDATSAVAAGWLTVAEAAWRTGISRRMWQVRARVLAQDGLAVLLPTRGKRVWWVCLVSEPTFDHHNSENLAALNSAPEAHRVRAYRRERWLREYVRVCVAQPQLSRFKVAVQSSQIRSMSPKLRC